jgi:tetratricopeptide (TPR) repeat protein
MTKEDLNNLLMHPEQTSLFVDELKRLCETYPWFHTAHQLLLKALKTGEQNAFDEQLSRSAWCVCRRDILYRYLHENRTAGAAPAPKTSGDLIDAFLQTKPGKIIPGETPFHVQTSDQLHVNPSTATETLAKIFARQGDSDKAIEIYEQLILKYPEKNSYFAQQIHHLKTSKNNSNV